MKNQIGRHLILPSSFLALTLCTACSAPVDFDHGSPGNQTIASIGSGSSPGITGVGSDGGPMNGPTSPSSGAPAGDATTAAPSTAPTTAPVSDPTTTSTTSPSQGAVSCRSQNVWNGQFTLSSAMVDGGSSQLIFAHDIMQLSNVDGNVIADAWQIPAGINNIHGTLDVSSEEIGFISDIDLDVCARTNVFNGVVQNVLGHVDLAPLLGNAPVALSQLHDVTSATIHLIHVNNVHDIHGDLVISDGGTITEIANVQGDIHLMNTEALYIHDVTGQVYIDSASKVDAIDPNSVKPIQ